MARGPCVYKMILNVCSIIQKKIVIFLARLEACGQAQYAVLG